MKSETLSKYLKKDKGITPKTVRAEQELWDQIKALAEKYECSQNEVMVAALKRVCAEELQ